MNEEELLLHFGVKGMKWGVRRARNSVGSVTRSFKNAHDKADASKNARRTASQERQNNSKLGQAHLKANAKKEARRAKQNANLAEHKRLEKERADKVVAKVKSKVESSKSYKEAQKNKKSEAKRKDTSDKVKNGIDTKLSDKSKLSSAALETALYMSVGALAAKTLGYKPIIGAGLGLGMDYLVADSKEK